MPPRTSPAPARVSDGVPWWLWLIMVVFGAAIVTSLVRKSIPEDPNAFYEQAMAALQSGNASLAEKHLQKLKDFPEFSGKQKFLEGILLVGQSKPLLAIPLLQEASKDPAIRIQALGQLGNAYLRGGQRSECVSTYETAVQEDENANDARLSLANVLGEMLCWEDSLKHLEYLKGKEFRPSVVGKLVADIYSDMGRFEEAAVEYQAAIRADPTDATNSQKAYELVSCMIETGNFEAVDEFLPMVDVISFRESARALDLINKNELDQALVAVGEILGENPDDPLPNRVYGQIMLKMGTKEKAVAALKVLRRPLEFNARNPKLFEVVAGLAVLAEEPQLAALAQQNVDQLRELEAVLNAKLSEVIKTRDDIQARLELGDLAAGVSRLQLAQSIYRSVSAIDASLEPVVLEKTRSLYGRPVALVSIEDAFIDFEADDVPAESTPAESTPAESTPAESTPAESTPAESTPAEPAPAEPAPAEPAPAEPTPTEPTPTEPTPTEPAPSEPKSE